MKQPLSSSPGRRWAPNRRRLLREVGILAVLLVCYAIGASRVRNQPDHAAPGAGTHSIGPGTSGRPGPSPPDTPRETEPSWGPSPRPVPAPGSTPTAGDLPDRPLAERRLLIPVSGVAPTQLSSSYDLPRQERKHEALDIMAPRGTPVVAVEDGPVVKLFTSAAGGLTVYQFDPSGRYAYYYAHLDRYADGLREGARLKRGDPIGTVGSTGNASPAAPHLHFAIFALGPERRWWEGTPIDPYPILSRSEPEAQRQPDGTRQ